LAKKISLKMAGSVWQTECWKSRADHVVFFKARQDEFTFI
jgi:hypothetical protein